MDTTNHNKRQYSAAQSARNIYCFAPEKQVRGAYFDVHKILLTILHTSQQGGVHYSLLKGKSPPFKREMEGFCKEKEKLFAYLWGGPPLSKSINISKLRENLSDFAGFVVFKFTTLRRQIW